MFMHIIYICIYMHISISVHLFPAIYDMRVSVKQLHLCRPAAYTQGRGMQDSRAHARP